MAMELAREESAGTTSDGGHHILLELAQGGTANVVLAVLRGAQGVDKLVVLKSSRRASRTPIFGRCSSGRPAFPRG